MKHDQTPGFQNYKTGPGQESKMAAVMRRSKTTKSTSSPEPLGIIGYKLAWNISGTLVFKIIKIREIHSRIRSQLPNLVFTSPVLIKFQYLKKT